MTPGEHYDVADYLVQRAGERLERILADEREGDVSTTDRQVLEAELRLAAVHATLATVPA